MTSSAAVSSLLLYVVCLFWKLKTMQVHMIRAPTGVQPSSQCSTFAVCTGLRWSLSTFPTHSVLESALEKKLAYVANVILVITHDRTIKQAKKKPTHKLWKVESSLIKVKKSFHYQCCFCQPGLRHNVRQIPLLTGRVNEHRPTIFWSIYHFLFCVKRLKKYNKIL